MPPNTTAVVAADAEPNAPAGVSEARRALLRDGPESLSLERLLTILLGRRLPPEAERALMLEAGGPRGLHRRSARELAALPGLGDGSAVRIAAACELGRRAASSWPRGDTFHTSEDVARAFRHLAALERETLWSLALDARHRLLAARRIVDGTKMRCVLRPGDILAPALKDGATALVVVHNHPSGDPEPSPQDVALTQRLARACDVVGLRFLDHVVVAAGGHQSILG